MNRLDIYRIICWLIFAKLYEKFHEFCVDIIVFLPHLLFSEKSQRNNSIQILGSGLSGDLHIMYYMVYLRIWVVK